MNNSTIAHIIRFILLVLIQGLVLIAIDLDGSRYNYLDIIIYPLFLFVLPLKTSHTVMLLLGFLLGISVDVFYGTLGVHASAGVLTGFVRRYVLRFLEPKGGYSANQIPSRYYLGFAWFLRYAGVLLFFHLLFLFSMEEFSPVYILDILLKTIISLPPSLAFIMLFSFIANPR